MDISWSDFLCHPKKRIIICFFFISICFLGDRKHLNEAKKAAHDFYKDLTVTVEDITHPPPTTVHTV